MSTLLQYIALGLVAAFVVKALFDTSRKNKYGPGQDYAAKSPLTENERDFHNRLKAAFPDRSIECWPQVSFLALLEPRAKSPRNLFYKAFNRISARRVDWLMVENCRPRLVIELDDASHNSKDDADRDRLLLQTCGLKTLRFQARSKPDVLTLRRVITETLASATDKPR
jgi:hypothetical protein